MNFNKPSTSFLWGAVTLVAGLWLAIDQSVAAPGDLDPVFNSSANKTVRAIAVQPDGKIFIGGDFTSVNGVAREHVARLNADGSLDTSFDPDLAADNRNQVFSVALQPDGKILIGGYLVTTNNTNYVARLNPNGSVDSSFASETGVTNSNALVYSIVIQPDAKIIIGAEMNAIYATNTIARLNTNGSPDVSFNPGTGTDDAVRSIALQPDGKIIIGGWFVNVNGTNRNRIARLNADGSLDETFDPGTGANNDVESVVLQPNGNVLLGGFFTTVNDTNRSYIARLNPDGSLDESFDPGAGIAGVALPAIYSVVPQFDGKLFIGGRFTTVNSTNRSRIARLNPDGSLDTSFDPGTGVTGPQSPTVLPIALQQDDKVLIGGLFTTVNGAARTNLARLIGDARLAIQRLGGSVVVNWSSAGFSLQSAPLPTGTFTNVDAASPYTNPANTPQRYFRLKAN